MDVIIVTRRHGAADCSPPPVCIQRSRHIPDINSKARAHRLCEMGQNPNAICNQNVITTSKCRRSCHDFIGVIGIWSFYCIIFIEILCLSRESQRKSRDTTSRHEAAAAGHSPIRTHIHTGSLTHPHGHTLHVLHIFPLLYSYNRLIMAKCHKTEKFIFTTVHFSNSVTHTSAPTESETYEVIFHVTVKVNLRLGYKYNYPG